MMQILGGDVGRNTNIFGIRTEIKAMIEFDAQLLATALAK